MYLEELDTPAIWVDLEIMERNLSRMGDYCRDHGIALRPHIKTHKVPELAWRQLESGACGITSAKVTEAQVMAASGIEDILVAYPVWGEQKWRALAALAGRGRISLATDSVEQAEAMAGGLGGAAKEISLLVEVDVGAGRTGLALDDNLSAEVARIAETGIPVAGIMFYPGHIKETDAEKIERLGERVGQARRSFEKAGVTVSVVSGGSTPTAYYSHLLRGVTEIRPGTYIFNDCNYVEVGAAGWEDCALKVRCRVVSTAVPGKAIIDGGSKTFSDAGRLRGAGHGRLVQCPRVLFEKMNEEHGYLLLGDSGFAPKAGDLVDIIPNHVCTAVNMHHVMYGVRRGRVEEIWQVAAQGKIH